jgi:hypothetical protein
MSDEQREWHKRHPSFEAFDEIRIFTVPRYKTSGLSGDEWRTAAHVDFFFKGRLVHQTGFRDVETAIAMLPGAVAEATSPIPTGVIDAEKVACDQTGCSKDAIARYFLKELYSARGEKLDASEKHARYYRQFCEVHLQRGDCGLEDADRNYEPATGSPGPADARGWQAFAREAGQVRVEVDSLEELPAAVEKARREAAGRGEG